MNCSHCGLPITLGDASPLRDDYHAFCGEIVKGECIEELERFLRSSPDYVEVSPGKWMAKKDLTPDPGTDER